MAALDELTLPSSTAEMHDWMSDSFGFATHSIQVITLQTHACRACSTVRRCVKCCVDNG